ncbi:ATP-binding protein [Methanothermobacter marburgensis]|uniref:ATP-binding protein n=1 Tax=Methanothermobacter marburgensis TaxID=145263 RepID=UPI000A0284C7|nr:ATP-binding protein [Methanothermobacter marburgensis]WBF10474.1 ATP-binding protein [Methanothermobacter marburgensis]
MDYKVNSVSDNSVFVETESYRRLLEALEVIRESRGNILHVVGAPGTGKSANLYRGIQEVGLDVYEVPCNLESADVDADYVFRHLLDEMKAELGADNRGDLYSKLAEFDAVVFADRFHDSHDFSEFTGFSQWTATAGSETLKFYLKCILEYIRNTRKFSNMNIIFQTAWRFYFRGKKLDIFTDIPILSSVLFHSLRIPFTAVRIDYTVTETLNIIKAHSGADEEEIRRYIELYGCRPRTVLEKMRSC